MLDVHHNRITDAAPVAALTSLRILNLSSNRVAVLPHLCGLTCLAELNLRRNYLTSLHSGAPAVTGSLSDGEAPGDTDSPSCSVERCSSSGAVDAGAGAEGDRGAAAVAAGKGGAARAAAMERVPGLPLCLQRLFASHNKVAAVGDVPALRALTQLRELALDANPVMSATHEIVRCPQALISDWRVSVVLCACVIWLSGRCCSCGFLGAALLLMWAGYQLFCSGYREGFSEQLVRSLERHGAVHVNN